MENQIAVTVTGGNRVDLVKKLRAFADNLDGAPLDEEVQTKTTKKGKKAVAPADDDFDDSIPHDTEAQEDFDTGEETELEATSDDDDFMSEPKKTAKPKKITIAQVNEACKARAKSGGKQGRAQVLGILKKHFKTESISEIKPEQYGKVIRAMAVAQ